MKELSSWLITILLFINWALRLFGAINNVTPMVDDFFVNPSNQVVEVILLFAFLILIPFIFKRKVWAALILFGAYVYYLGGDLVSKLSQLNTLNLTQQSNLIFDVIGIVLALFAVVDILLDIKRTKNPVDKKTDWYYKGDQYDRKLDDRADKNNYRMY